MSTLEELRGGVNHIWDSVTDGWRHLVSRASNALTRFHSGKSSNKSDLPVAVKGSEWGLLATDLYDDGKHVVVSIEAPGMEQGDFDISVQEDVLVVRGEKKYHSERREKGYQIAECAYGAFERAIPLPDNIDPENTRAKYRKGVLRIEIPKSGDSHHKVKIQSD